MGFPKLHRTQLGVLAGPERRLLLWMARRLPPFASPDHLTALALLSMLGAGTFYILAERDPRFLHLVNLCLILNWWGDSLDGTLARQRGMERPRYGYYVDHILDNLGLLFLVVGMGLSGLMSPLTAAALLIGYFLLSLHVYLLSCVDRRFRMSFWRLGPTELRLLLMVGNWLVLLAHSKGWAWRGLLELPGLIAAALLLGTALLEICRATRELYRLERRL